MPPHFEAPEHVIRNAKTSTNQHLNGRAQWTSTAFRPVCCMLPQVRLNLGPASNAHPIRNPDGVQPHPGSGDADGDPQRGTHGTSRPPVIGGGSLRAVSFP